MTNAYINLEHKGGINLNNTFLYDERPGFESYNMMNFTPGMPIMYPNMNYNSSCQNNNIDNRINKLENEINNLQNRVSRLEGNMYPEAVNYNSYPKSTYQNSLNM